MSRLSRRRRKLCSCLLSEKAIFMKIRRHHSVLALGLLLLPYRLPAQTDPPLQPFTIDHRKALLAHSPVDVSFLLDAPAGKHGFVRAQGGHLVSGYGKRIRFWGVNITDWSKGSVMIPSKDDAPLWAATLAPEYQATKYANVEATTSPIAFVTDRMPA